MSEVIIAERFCGPSDSANGGYTCGLIAAHIEGPAQVTLRKPPPLDRPLKIERNPDGTVSLLDNESLIADGAAVAVDGEVPEAMTLDEARLGAQRYEWAAPEDHPYPHCFVCGPSRGEHDGMRIFPGPVPGTDLYGATWRPDDSLVHPHGHVRPEFVWAALDCPSGLVTNTFKPAGRILLGRLAAQLVSPVPGGREYVLASWPIEQSGRKMSTGSALFSEWGELHAVARAVWIEVADDPGAAGLREEDLPDRRRRGRNEDANR